MKLLLLSLLVFCALISVGQSQQQPEVRSEVQSEDQLMAREQLNLGVKAYKNADYQEAIEHFKSAVELDSNLSVAKLYLATAYSQQFKPGVKSPDNGSNAQMALDIYKSVLQEDPDNVTSLKGMASLYMDMKKFDDAHDYYLMAIRVAPDDPENYYSVGVIDWTMVYKDVSDRKAQAGLKVEDPVKNQQLCEQIKIADSPKIEEGIRMLQTALEKREHYADAMTYMNLLYRRKADTECGDKAAAQAQAEDVKRAKDWTNNAMEARKIKAENADKKP